MMWQERLWCSGRTTVPSPWPSAWHSTPPTPTRSKTSTHSWTSCRPSMAQSPMRYGHGCTSSYRTTSPPSVVPFEQKVQSASLFTIGRPCDVQCFFTVFYSNFVSLLYFALLFSAIWPLFPITGMFLLSCTRKHIKFYYMTKHHSFFITNTWLLFFLLLLTFSLKLITIIPYAVSCLTMLLLLHTENSQSVLACLIWPKIL